MFDGLKRSIAGSAAASFLKSLATNKDTQTTISGLLAGAVLAIPGLDLGRVIGGDPHQIAKLVTGILVFCIGLLATREQHDGTTTLLGTVAGALQASQGSLEAISSGVVIAVLGYLTNKPTGATAAGNE